MAWSMEGQLFECCNCEVVCPCSSYPFQGADYDRCVTVYGFRIDAGEIEGVDVAGTTAAVAGDLPKYFLDGNWRVGLLIDEAASDEQAAKLAAVFSGELGGPLAAVSGLVPTGVENGPPARLRSAGFHPVTAAGLSDGEVTLSRADAGSDLEAFGLHWRPKAGLWAHFSWRG